MSFLMQELNPGLWESFSKAVPSYSQYVPSTVLWVRCYKQTLYTLFRASFSDLLYHKTCQRRLLGLLFLRLNCTINSFTHNGSRDERTTCTGENALPLQVVRSSF